MNPTSPEPADASHDASSSRIVNPHYLDHVMVTARKRELEASEDIISGTGLKLLAKGARIDDSVKERLLRHKLRKPLEECLRVVSGVNANDLAYMAETLFDRHPLLRELHATRGVKAAVTELRGSIVSASLESMLTVYVEQGGGKLEHAVGASLVCMGLADKVGSGDVSLMRTVMLAGLCHDVGELYIDPGYLRKGRRLPAAQWKHVVAHPIVGQRVLRDMPRVGERIGEAVLGHHERLDGFGYPYGLRGEHVPQASQVLGVGELLIGLIESRRAPVMAADVALKLVPGEFGRGLVDAVSAACRACAHEESALAKMPPLATTQALAATVAHAIRRIDAARSHIDTETATSPPAFRLLMQQALDRHERIRRAFSSTGVDADNFDVVLHDLHASGNAELLIETTLVIREVAWRYRELERELRLRTERAAAAEMPRLEGLLAWVQQDRPQSHDAPHAPDEPR